MIRASSILLIYLLALFLPMHVPALPSEEDDDAGCGCSITIEECCCAAPESPVSSPLGFQTCPRDRDSQAALPTLSNHLAAATEVAECATPELPRPARLILPANPIPDPIDTIPPAC